MRLIIPIFIIVLGALTGAVVGWLFQKTATGLKLSVAAGGIGAFVGLLVRGALDVTTGSSQGDALLAILLGAVVFSVLSNILLGKLDK